MSLQEAGTEAPDKTKKKPEKPRAKGSSAVMQQRTECPDSIDFFPTPPWASRSFCEFVLPRLGNWDLKKLVCQEPAAGEGHMSEPLKEYFGTVHCADVHDYGRGHRIGSYIGEGLDVLPPIKGGVDWVITNPPFNGALDFALRALSEARVGVALLVRLAWIETETRWDMFSKFMPTAICQPVERIGMAKGYWVPDLHSATAYAWVVWVKPFVSRDVREEARMMWIPPGQKQRLTRPDDFARFAKVIPAPLFDPPAPAGEQAGLPQTTLL